MVQRIKNIIKIFLAVLLLLFFIETHDFDVLSSYVLIQIGLQTMAKVYSFLMTTHFNAWISN